jgi:hypothetical protein
MPWLARRVATAPCANSELCFTQPKLGHFFTASHAFGFLHSALCPAFQCFRWHSWPQ